jgi:predicted phosphodiesterase
MKIQYMSDLHLEFPENRQYFKENPVEPVGDILILAGDIVCDSERESATDFFNDIQSKFSLIISTMGNHEFYFGEISYAYPSYKHYFSDNHVMLNNQTMVIDNVKFIVSALWSQVVPEHEAEIFRRLNDYRYISKAENGSTTTVSIEDTNYYHRISREYIEQELAKDFAGKVVVVTHHLPSLNCVIPKWRGSTLVSAFANQLDDLILNNKIDYWIFGHQHEQFSDFIGNTHMLSNPLGYAKEENFQLFRSSRFFEV